MKVYFSGIGGVGLGPLAEIAKDAGYTVDGSDQQESLMTRQLQSRGININIGQDGSHLLASHTELPVNQLVYTAALPADHPELALAKKLGIKTVKRDELLAHIIKDKNLRLLAVAGTHGKTTTASMLVWTLSQLGMPLSYSVGSTLSFGPSGKFNPASRYFVYECDEFDRNFLHFHPHLSLVTSVGYDHPDTYPTEADYLAAFRKFGQQSKQLVAWQDQHQELFKDHPSALLLSSPAKLPIAGEHNRRNATLVLEALKSLGIDGNHSRAIETFPGASRRFERLSENLYSDYGHHPAEIAATLQMASELSSQIVLVYQPHQNIRQHEIKGEYTNQFELAEKIYWLPTYLSRENSDLPILEPKELISDITNKSSIEIADLNDDLWRSIQSARQNGKLVLAMGAGSIDDWLRKQLT